ncbi:MAG: T9SS type A sorting domain-containing protein [Bacteroidales bacterium]|nr:T9SS type A sorting domain-containing protein [Bacteroidales bacterium]MDD3860104.1 T9SS type A sorting domain-containing protein [Bacteroidales bacterium]
MANKSLILFYIIILFPLLILAQKANPILITNLDDLVSETSGLLIYNNKVWTHNDSGCEPKLYQIDTITGAIITEKTILNAFNTDWEDICRDDNYAYIGDFGNNNGTREDLKIYRISLLDLDNNSLTSIESEIIYFSYDTEIYPETTKDNNTDFDCEALIAKGDSLYLFSKNWINKKCYLYSVPKIPGNYITYRIDSLDTQGLVCGADYNLETNSVSLIGYVYGIPAPSFIYILSDFENNDFFSGNIIRCELNMSGYQTESVVFRDNNRLWITNENFLGHIQSLYEINLLSLGIIKKHETAVCNIYPNPAKDQISVMINLPEKFRYSLSNSNGNCLMKTYKKQYFNEPVKIDISMLPAGIYFIELTSQNCQIKSKFIKL